MTKHDASHFGHSRRRRFLPALWLSGAGTLAALGLAASGSLAGFTASIDNTTNTAGTGSVIMTEVSGANTCTSTQSGSTITSNAANCPTINKLGGNLLMVPGQAVATSVAITNSGTSPVTTAFTLTPGGCSVSSNGSPAGSDTAGFCGKVDVSVWDATAKSCVVGPASATTAAACAPSSTSTLASVGTTPIALPVPLAAGASVNFVFSTEIDPTATNADMDLQVSDPLTWTFNA